MSAAGPASPMTQPSSAEQAFPTLAPAQIARVAAHGRVRQVPAGEVLLAAGVQAERIYVVTAGRLELVRTTGDGEKLVAVQPPGHFTGEVNILSGRRVFISARMAEAGEVIEVDRQQLLALTQTDSELTALENLSQFEGAGVYYGATFVEAQLCRGDEVIVVGGGNSAGQAAVFLAQTARRVHVLIRSGGLAASMSRYLIRRIEEHPGIVLRTHTEIEALEGDEHLQRVRWRDQRADRSETHGIRHVFVMTGATPNTAWLNDCVALDAQGFIKTGPDLSPDDLAAARWPLTRPPYLLETSLPGVFAVGDVRGGNVKRVASAVGEGSIAVSFVHQVLKE